MLATAIAHHYLKGFLLMDNKIEKEFVEYVIKEMVKETNPMDEWEIIFTRVATEVLIKFEGMRSN